jgi:hypothetical protein
MTPAVENNCGSQNKLPVVDWELEVRRSVPPGYRPILSNLRVQAGLIKTASRLLFRESISEKDARAALFAEISELQQHSDRLIRENAFFFCDCRLPILPCLTQDFTDLQILSSRLDDILDAIEDAAFRLSFHRGVRPTGGISRFCECLILCIDHLHKDVETIVQGVDPPVASAEIRLRTREARHLLRGEFRELFADESDAIVLLENKEICDVLDRALKFCRAAFRQILSINISGSSLSRAPKCEGTV